MTEAVTRDETLWLTYWTQKSQAIPVDRLLWSSVPTIRGIPVEHPACCDLEPIILALCTMSPTSLTFGYHPVGLSMEALPNTHITSGYLLPSCIPFIRWILRLDSHLSQSTPSRYKQPSLAMWYLKKRSTTLYWVTLPSGSLYLIIQIW